MSLEERLAEAVIGGVPVHEAFEPQELKQLVGLGLCVEFQGERGKHIGIRPTVRRKILRLRRPIINWGWSDE